MNAKNGFLLLGIVFFATHSALAGPGQGAGANRQLKPSWSTPSNSVSSNSFAYPAWASTWQFVSALSDSVGDAAIVLQTTSTDTNSTNTCSILWVSHSKGLLATIQTTNGAIPNILSVSGNTLYVQNVDDATDTNNYSYSMVKYYMNGNKNLVATPVATGFLDNSTAANPLPQSGNAGIVIATQTDASTNPVSFSYYKY